MKNRKVKTFAGFIFLGLFVTTAAVLSFAQCVDFDGDGRADSCGTTGNVPTPTYKPVNTDYPATQKQSYSTQQKAPAKKASPKSSAPSMDAMIGTAIMGGLLEAVFSSPPEPAGPTQEELEAQWKLEQQKKIEFQRSNNNLMHKLKGSTSSPETDVVVAGGLKLKKVPGRISSVALLRDPVTDAIIDSAWLNDQKKLIEQRVEEPNKWSESIYQSLKTEAPPLPYKKFDELQSGDVVLVNAEGTSLAINKADNLLSGDNTSAASHSVLYLREVNGVKHFMENVPGKGPHIIFEDEFLRKYGSRGTQVAKLAQPLNDTEAKKLYSAAVEMAAKNRKEVNSSFFGTNYGAWGKDNVVCSEADWALLNISRKTQIPKTADNVKTSLGIDFSPADFFNNGQYFLVSPLDTRQ